MNKEKEEKIADLEFFPKKLKFMILHCVLCGVLGWGIFSGMSILIDYLFVDRLPFWGRPAVMMFILSFCFVMIYVAAKRILHLYYYFKFLIEMLLEDLKKMATILYGLQKAGHIIQVDDPQDIKDFIEKLGGKKPDKETLH